jgi:hypothetical protein
LSAYDRPPPWRLTPEIIEAFMVKLKPRRAPQTEPPHPVEPVEKLPRERNADQETDEPTEDQHEPTE